MSNYLRKLSIVFGMCVVGVSQVVAQTAIHPMFLPNTSWQETQKCDGREEFGFLDDRNVRVDGDIMQYRIVRDGVELSRGVGSTLQVALQVLDNTTIRASVLGKSSVLFRCGMPSVSAPAPSWSAAPAAAVNVDSTYHRRQLGANCRGYLQASERNAGDVNIAFTNHRRDTVYVGWVNFSGEVEVLSALTPGNTIGDVSHPQHRYVVLDGAANCVSAVRLGLLDEHVQVR